ncbi:MAG: 3-deoxy-manno-octulosonate cytidylyltransferase (CMP-KDO synthetase) [Gammaproteobacteria bacterium]|jgi:3-deoxy-manno-octulosonate cytidylyltransferase (CMP-KDO synthetase)
MRKSKILKIDFKFQIIIPARYASTRLPGKPLLEINGKPLIQHVYESACLCEAEKVYIATDDWRIQEKAESFGADVIMTTADHLSGTDRLAEAVSILQLKNEAIIVNLQGDEIDMPASLVHQVAKGLYEHPQHSIATLCVRIEQDEDIKDPNVVKVVFDQNNTALYFSRATIPHLREEQIDGENQQANYFKHLGLYAYRVDYLKKFSTMSVCDLERSESLEQLRALYTGEKIYIEEACASAGIGIDTEEDLIRARQQTRT